MNSPPVHYTRTNDGFSIAYMVSGQGPPIVMLPQLFQHSQRLWAGGPIAALLGSLSQDYTVVQYDSRGQGMSQRGLPATHSMEAYERDLEAVIAALRLEKIALFAANQFGHVAVRYAVEHPSDVAALILLNTSLDSRYGTLSTNEMAQMAVTNWDAYLLITARSVFPAADPIGMVSYFKVSPYTLCR